MAGSAARVNELRLVRRAAFIGTVYGQAGLFAYFCTKKHYMPCSTTLIREECPVRHEGLSQAEIESALMPLIKNRTCKIEPVIIETEYFIKVDFQITFLKEPRETVSSLKKYHQEGGFSSIVDIEPMSSEEKAVRDAVEVLRRCYCK